LKREREDGWRRARGKVLDEGKGTETRGIFGMRKRKVVRK